jgi:hypothetical protein
MVVIVIVLSVLGFAAVLYGSIDAYRARPRIDPDDPQTLRVTTGGPTGMIVAIAGGVVGLLASLLSLLL